MTFEENLAKLESLTNDIKRTDISLEDALKDFEEGIKLAKSLESALDKIEGKIQILTNQPVKAEKNPAGTEISGEIPAGVCKWGESGTLSGV